jgi:hypothetical protein
VCVPKGPPPNSSGSRISIRHRFGIADRSFRERGQGVSGVASIVSERRKSRPTLSLAFALAPSQGGWLPEVLLTAWIRTFSPRVIEREHDACLVASKISTSPLPLSLRGRARDTSKNKKKQRRKKTSSLFLFSVLIPIHLSFPFFYSFDNIVDQRCSCEHR